jgi:hypothetical protein
MRLPELTLLRSGVRGGHLFGLFRESSSNCALEILERTKGPFFLLILPLLASPSVLRTAARLLLPGKFGTNFVTDTTYRLAFSS